MIELILNAIINELGPVGLLVIGLYFILYRPLKKMSLHLGVINGELGMIIQMLRDWKDDRPT